MEKLELSIFSTTIHLWLFIDVKNSSDLRQSLVKASLTGIVDEQKRLDWAFLDASMITSRQHLVTAVCQALVTRSHGELKTKTLHSEILWALSPGTNIMDAIKKFGLDAQTSELLLVKLLPTDDPTPKEQLDRDARSLVIGQLVPLNELGHTMADWKELRRLYKLNDDAIIKELDKKLRKEPHGTENELWSTIDQIIVSTVALKPVAG